MCIFVTGQYEYTAACLPSKDSPSWRRCQLYILSNSEANVSIQTVDSSTSFTLAPLTMHIEEYTPEYWPERDEAESKAIHVTSDVDLQVLIHTGGHQYGEVYNVPNQHRADTVHYTAAYNHGCSSTSSDWCQFFLVTSFSDDTTITVMQQNGTMYTVNLPAFGTFARATNDPSYLLTSGTKITSSKPVNVVSGNLATLSGGGGGWPGALVSSMPAKQTLGQDYLVPRILGEKGQGGFFVHVVATENNTDISINEEVVQAVREGDHVEREFSSETIVTCSKNCMVIQFVNHRFDMDYRHFMQHILPAEDFMTSAFFSTVDRSTLQWSFLALVVEGRSNGDDLLLNDISLENEDWKFTNGYSTVHVPIMPGGVFTVNSTQGLPFAAYVYSAQGQHGWGFPILPINASLATPSLTRPPTPSLSVPSTST